jgi:DNA damage-binding protein 1
VRIQTIKVLITQLLKYDYRKSNRLEIYTQTIEGLLLVHTKSVYGYITMLERLRPSTSTTDHLFVGTDRYQYFTISWDASRKEIRTEQSYLDQADRVLRDSREADRCHIDPSRRFMTLELYDGVVTVIPLQQATDRGQSAKRQSVTKQEDRGILGYPVQVRIEELATRSSAYLDVDSSSRAKPRLAILWEDNADAPQLKMRELDYFPDAAGDQASAELKTVAEFRGHLDLGVSHLVPVPAPSGGFLVLGERSITYIDSDLKTAIPRNLEDDATVWCAWERVDDQRWLLADDYGRLYVLMIMVADGRVRDWRLDKVGETSKASTLVYLDGGLVYVGSHSGDSRVVKIEESGLTVVQTFDNIAPILDFTIMDLGRGAEGGQSNEFSSGQARLVTASGAWRDGTIRSVRSGVGMEELGSLGEILHITDMWGLSSGGDRNVQDTLLVTFVDETRIFKFDSEASIEEVDVFHGLEMSEATLLASNLPNNRILQVSETSIRIADLDGGMTTACWKPPDGSKITATACNDERLLVVSGGVTLHVFDLTNDLTTTNSKTFPTDSQIASVTIPCTPTSIGIIAFWQSASITIIDLDSLDLLHTQILGPTDTSIPRSVVVANVLPDSPPTLFVAMADGVVTTYALDMAKNVLNNMTRIVLGSEPVTFKKLPQQMSAGSGSTFSNIFASCEQSSLIYASEGRMVYSAVNSDKASRVCHFNSHAYPGAIAIATPSELKLALIDTERTTQLHTLPVGETVRCVAYSEDLKMFGMGCIRRVLGDGAEALFSSFKVADEVTFKELDSVALKDGELIECVIGIPTPSDDDVEGADMFAVGTSMLDESAEQSVKGRILIYQVNKEKKLRKVTELGVKGACRSLALCDGKIVAGLVKTVRFFH